MLFNCPTASSTSICSTSWSTHSSTSCSSSLVFLHQGLCWCYLLCAQLSFSVHSWECSYSQQSPGPSSLTLTANFSLGTCSAFYALHVCSNVPSMFCTTNTQSWAGERQLQSTISVSACKGKHPDVQVVERIYPLYNLYLMHKEFIIFENPNTGVRQ